MSSWNVNFENGQSLKRVQLAVAALEKVESANLSPQDGDLYNRLLKLLKILERHFSLLDPEFCTQGQINNWGAWTSQIQSQVESYAQNRNIGHVQNGNNIADAILDSLRPLNALPAGEEAKAIADAAASLNSKIVSEIGAHATDVDTQLEKLLVEINQGKVRLVEHNQVIEQQKARLDQAIAEFQKQFSTAQETRAKDFSEEAKKQADKFLDLTSSFAEQFKLNSAKQQESYDVMVGRIREQGDTHLKFLKQREEEVNKIFGAIGTSAFAGNFKITADKDRTAADRWRLVAMVLMGAIAIAAIFAFYYSVTGKTDWEAFLFRLGTCVFLAVPAFYAANESAKHRETERLNRKIHLELTAIDAYLALMPDAQRNEIKGKLTEKFFGVPEIKEKSEPVSQKDLFGLISTAVSNLTKGK